jgi:hypothetical protein
MTVRDRAEDLSSWASRMPLSASASRNSEGLTNQPAVEPVRQVGTTRDEPRTFAKPGLDITSVPLSRNDNAPRPLARGTDRSILLLRYCL